ncbi:bifunctional ADP-dependent NAD(P)H-hydrate dehydratase/NAD(P)H-hydrate epimerase [Pseudorhodobacter aquimaris]|uniref:bifunctional ADP-dependent NAD(P)H-hydrate dehydratase/NAD(P)H-hydrate epimerase n=1 Tax=Pseudorhodobacter aquimaris TaxID=687412 RepID=UPI00067C3EE1|nr:bifunctional ADP-dependent NAD(P)H-hydrate dehydratase/NAD(P)H-hydrate epimerase [Pseudorhodobacter aquimaris]
MTELLTSAQMRAIEQAAIASGSVTGLELMERAGRGVVQAIHDEWPALRVPARAVVLCGPGNNGGDGFVVARLLQEAGWSVEVFLYGDPANLPPDARVNFDRWSGKLLLAETLAAALDRDDLALVVDALFGTGLTRQAPRLKPVEQLMQRGRHDDKASGPTIVAIDIPSDRCSDSGRVIKGNVPDVATYMAHLTVTFHRAKRGHYLGAAPAHCGRLRIVDIGLSGAGGPAVTVLVESPQDDPVIFQQIKKSGRAHKFSHGHALVLSGGIASGGAARLAARAALRMGAGLVTLGCPPSALLVNAAQLNAVMVKPVADGRDLECILKDKRITALCLGPGMGSGPVQVNLLGVALTGQRPMVLDADALTLLAQEPRLFGLLHPACVLTPHAGEFARLFPDIAARLTASPTKGPAFSKIDACQEAAARAGCTVLFKGPDTVIAAPDGRCALNAACYDRAAPWLATAGSGDVLAGLVTGLLARGMGPFEAAGIGAWLHVECANYFGPGLIAEDLPEVLPKVFHALEARPAATPGSGHCFQ